jgi:hypothetical protein
MDIQEIIERAKVYALYGADGDEVNLGAEIERLTAENVRLQGLVRGAFVEGWQAGFGAGASEDPLSENPDLDAWGDAKTRLALAETATAQRDGDYGTPEGTR